MANDNSRPVDMSGAARVLLNHSRNYSDRSLSSVPIGDVFFPILSNRKFDCSVTVLATSFPVNLTIDGRTCNSTVIDKVKISKEQFDSIKRIQTILKSDYHYDVKIDSIINAWSLTESVGREIKGNLRSIVLYKDRIFQVYYLWYGLDWIISSKEWPNLGSDYKQVVSDWELQYSSYNFKEL